MSSLPVPSGTSLASTTIKYGSESGASDISHDFPFACDSPLGDTAIDLQEVLILCLGRLFASAPWHVALYLFLHHMALPFTYISLSLTSVQCGNQVGFLGTTMFGSLCVLVPTLPPTLLCLNTCLLHLNAALFYLPFFGVAKGFNQILNVHKIVCFRSTKHQPSS